jgi:glucose/arabinose dehydrogenase
MYRSWLRLSGFLLPVAVLATTGCPSAPPDVPAKTVNVAPGLQAEFLVRSAVSAGALAPTDDGRVFYGDRNTGEIRVLKNGVLLDEPFATLPVNFAGERGLLGLAVHPDFARNQRLYVFYTRSDTGAATSDPRAAIDNRVVYFEAAGDVAAGGEVFVVSLPLGEASAPIGGQLAFAPEGRLYVAMGDTGDPDSVQTLHWPVGKVLRYNDDGTIPSDNPQPDLPTYALGFHDPTGLAVHPQTRELFIVERNGNGPHEVNRVLPGGNYGWPIVTGFAQGPVEKAFVDAHPEYVDPVLETDEVELLGLSFNPSTRYGPTEYLQLLAGTADGRILHYALTADHTAVAHSGVFAEALPALTDVNFTPAGTLYVASRRAVGRVNTVP